MPWMKFTYRDFPFKPTPAFPGRTKVSRPFIHIRLKYQDHYLDTLALVDSGADFCVIPNEIGLDLGIQNPEAGPAHPTKGFGEQEYPVYFHNIEIIIGGHKFAVWAGFSDKISFPILGQDGFFNNFEVKINYRKKQIEIKPHQD